MPGGALVAPLLPAAAHSARPSAGSPSAPPHGTCAAASSGTGGDGGPSAAAAADSSLPTSLPGPGDARCLEQGSPTSGSHGFGAPEEGGGAGEPAPKPPWPPLPLLLPLQRLRWAFLTAPSSSEAAQAAAAALLFGLLIQPIVYASSLLHPGAVEFSPWLLLKALLVPCIAEEAFFRVLLNPHPREGPSYLSVLLSGALSVALFISWHPLNAWLLTPAVRPTFYKPGFLAIVAILGLLNQALYFRTGSVWPPVALHWLLVAVWLTLGGKAGIGA